LPNFIGWPDKEPLPAGIAAYTDCISPRFASAALIAALDYRNKTGKGQRLDLSQFETAIYFVVPGVLEYLSSGREPAKRGNSSPYAAPHGVYPCKGDDRWCAIAAFDDREWACLCREMAKPECIEDPRFSTLMARKRHEDEVNRLIANWTSNLTPEDVMVKLQAVGVPAGVVKNGADLYDDPQLRSRNIYWPMEHAEMGLFTHLGQSFELSKTPAQPYTPSPLLGEHTEYVCREMLDMPDEEFINLFQEGVFD
jgi:benzylsuccinate CoA-transferase BbsF subunit